MNELSESYWMFKCPDCHRIHFELNYIFSCRGCGSEDLESQMMDDYNPVIEKEMKKRKQYVADLMKKVSEMKADSSFDPEELDRA